MLRASVMFAAVATVLAVATTVPASAKQRIVLRGSDSQNVRSFALTRDADVLWSCPGCSSSNFVFSTASDIPVNALNHTHGVSFLKKGRYSGVSVIVSGSWTIRLRTAGSRPLLLPVSEGRFLLSGYHSVSFPPEAPMDNLFQLPADLPVPIDDGGCDHPGTPPGETSHMPEPATLVSGLIGAGLMSLYSRRRRKQAVV